MAEEITAPVTYDYKSQANIRVEFYDTSLGGDTKTINTTGVKYWELFGFLTDEGLDLSLKNNFKNALDFGLLENAQAGLAGIKGLIGSIGGGEVGGYISGGFGGNSIILNAPYYWQGTDPITLSVALYQIADSEGDIIENYQRILEILSPGMGTATGEQAAKGITIAGNGPGLIKVHYFPEKGTGEGRVIFGPCLCQSASMKIAPPYNSKYMPIIGNYNFGLQVSRILDRTQIKNIFNNPNDLPTNPYLNKK